MIYLLINTMSMNSRSDFNILYNITLNIQCYLLIIIDQGNMVYF